jgi:tetratricopeptide (TPR) repeat protein
MASLSLRAYLQKIENLIDRGQTEEAIAHCKHILKKFPKHVDTYRLLGKAYLEMQRFQEASDVLQRVLSVFPDDFVSQIGLSIIHEDSSNMDEAIWHMERAFEIQPSNNAVQEELKRLYGKRDGVVPPKILLTRGALVRMYVRGEAYPQAIAEGIAALNEDPQRNDIEILLAKSYLRTNQINEAFNLCQKILNILPYSFEANQLIAEIHILSKQSDQSEPFLERIRMLDPYAAFVNENTPTSNKVDENAIVIDEMDFSEIAMNGMIQKSEENDLLFDDSFDDTEFGQIGIPESKDMAPKQEPDLSWLTESETEKEEPVPQAFMSQRFEPYPEQDQIEPEEEIIPTPPVKAPKQEAVSIPEFLQSISPNQTAIPEPAKSSISIEPQLPKEKISTVNSPIEPVESESSISQINMESDDLPDWLKELDQETKQSDIELDLENEIDSLFSKDGDLETSVPDISLSEDAKIDDEEDFTARFLADLENETQHPGKTRMFSMTAELPQEADNSFELSNESEPSQSDSSAMSANAPIDMPSEATEASTDIPDWLKELDERTSDFRLDKDEFQPAQTAQFHTQQFRESVMSQDDNYDDDLSTLNLSGSTKIESDSEEDAFAWLESLAAKQGVDESSLLSNEDERPDAPPEWILQESDQTQADTGNGFSELKMNEIPSVEAFNVVEEEPVTISKLEKEFPESEITEPVIENEQENSSTWIDEFQSIPPANDTQIQSSENEVAEQIQAPQQETYITPPQTPEEIPDWLKELEEQTSIYAISPKDKPSREQEFEQDLSSEKIDLPWASFSNHIEEKDDTKIAEPFREPLSVDKDTDKLELADNEDIFKGNLLEDISHIIDEHPLTSDFELYTPVGRSFTDEIESHPLNEIPLPEIVTTAKAMGNQPPIAEGNLPIKDESFEIPSGLIEDLIQEPEPTSPGILSGEYDFADLQKTLQSARDYLNKENYEPALILYDHLIESETSLNEVISDLTKAIYDHPLDPSIFIRLGDAYNRNNQIQKALDMYQEAESLLQK